MADGNPNLDLFDDQVRRRVSLERYSNGQIRKTAKLLEELEGDIRAKIAKAQPTSKRQLEALLRDVREIQAKAYEELNKRLEKDFGTLAGEEARFQHSSLGAAVEGTVNRLTVNAAITAANSRPMQGALLKDWLTDLDKNARARIEKALRISFIEGESLSATLQRLKGVTGINRRGLEALIRTANTHIAAAVQQASYEANGELIEELEWRATLDNRTTLICASRDGQRYPLKSGPRPPAHISCRSIMTPVLSKYPPPPRDTYSDWLKRQPESVQDEVLGKAMAAAFRKGTPLTSFVNKTGKTKTLKDLGLEPVRPKAKAAPKPKVPVKLPSVVEDTVDRVLAAPVAPPEAEVRDFARRYYELAKGYADHVIGNNSAGASLSSTAGRVAQRLKSALLTWDAVGKGQKFATIAELNAWSMNGNEWLMAQVRNPATKALSSVARQTQRKMDEAIAAWTKAKPSRPRSTFRGIRREFANKTRLWNAKVGDVVSLDEITATSESEGVAKAFAGPDGHLVEFKRVTLRSLDEVSEFSGEKEVLMPSTTRVRVLERKGGKRVKIVVEVLE